MMAVPCCGPRCAWCCTAFSVWGAIMLGFCGLFFYLEAVSMLEDLPMSEDELHQLGENPGDWSIIKDKYRHQAITCWIAAGLYVVTFAISIYMIRLNRLPEYNIVTKEPKVRHSAFS